MKKYQIIYENGERREIDGVAVKIKGFEFLDLFITQCDGSYAIKGRERIRLEIPRGKYAISDNHTGRNLFGAYENPEEAYSDTSRRLNDMGVEPVRLAFEKAYK